MSILGSSDVDAVQPHMLKLFDNCREVLVQRGKTVAGMLSDEGESYNFIEGIKVEKPVEGWMFKVDLEMQKTLKDITKEMIFNYAN